MKKRGHKRTKKSAQKIHATRRFLERFCINVSKDQMQEYISLIQKGQMQFAGRQSRRVSLWKYEIEGRDAWFVYDKARNTIVTVLDREPNWRSDDGFYGLGPYRPGVQRPSKAERQAMKFAARHPTGRRISAVSRPPDPASDGRVSSPSPRSPAAKHN